MEANKRRLTSGPGLHPSTLAEGLAVKGVSMLRSGQTAINREAGGRERLIPRFSAAPCAIANTRWERLSDDMLSVLG